MRLVLLLHANLRDGHVAYWFSAESTLIWPPGWFLLQAVYYICSPSTQPQNGATNPRLADPQPSLCSVCVLLVPRQACVFSLCVLCTHRMKVQAVSSHSCLSCQLLLSWLLSLTKHAVVPDLILQLGLLSAIIPAHYSIKTFTAHF